ncbi:MAG: PAS domain-containing sensor histidine kinase [Bacteroidetes bacterium]|nr:PAS domain-containing sensor histidine kinase [Bacteroidota bacterium]
MKKESQTETSGTSSAQNNAAGAYRDDDWMAFFNAIDEVYFSVDMIRSEVTRISEACEKLFGYTQADFMTRHQLWFSMVHPDDRHIIDGEYPALNRGEPVTNQYRVICKDQGVRWVSNKIKPHLDENGKLVRIEGITRDITAGKEADEKHRESEARYRQIVETAQEGIWTIDEHEKTNFVNKKIADMLGYAPEEMIGKELYDFMDAEGRAYALECMERRRRGSKENLDIRYKTKNGDDVWANISANPILDKNGAYKGALAMVTDITQRKLDEEALKKSEANLRTVFDNTDTAYVLIDTGLKIVSFNTLAQKYSEEQNRKKLVVGKEMSEYFTPERLPLIKDVLKKVAAGETVRYGLNYTKSDGTVHWYDVRWLNVRDNNGNNCGFILANLDITTAKLAELEREKITADLIQHNKDLEQFTYIISHNLRAPVANIMALTEMLEDKDIEPEVKNEITDRVSRSIQNLDTIIKDLNQILQARELANEKKETIYFHELMESIRASIHNIVVNEQVEFKYLFGEAESIFSIRSYLYSIFYNLSSNSIKYHRPGVAPVITIKTQRLKNKIEIRFKDNSKGIDLKKYSSQLFGLYKRFDNTVEGKGMGLFMVKTQVEALGGTIRIKSKPGEGTEFIIELPV